MRRTGEGTLNFEVQSRLISVCRHTARDDGQPKVMGNQGKAWLTCFCWIIQTLLIICILSDRRAKDVQIGGFAEL